MEHHVEMSGDAKLKALIWHLVTTFPHAAILSRPVEETYQLFIIVPYGGAPEKVIQVESSLLFKRDPSVEEFGSLLDLLNLTIFLQGRDWYDLSLSSGPSSISVVARHRSSVIAPPCCTRSDQHGPRRKNA